MNLECKFFVSRLDLASDRMEREFVRIPTVFNRFDIRRIKISWDISMHERKNYDSVAIKLTLRFKTVRSIFAFQENPIIQGSSDFPLIDNQLPHLEDLSRTLYCYSTNIKERYYFIRRFQNVIQKATSSSWRELTKLSQVLMHELSFRTIFTFELKWMQWFQVKYTVCLCALQRSGNIRIEVNKERR